MELLALRSGQILNQSELGRDAGLAQPTVHRYLNLLETTQLFERLPVYTVNRTSRLMKSPKSFWNDPGLAVFLSGYFGLDDLRKARELGTYFETLIFHHRFLSLQPPLPLHRISIIPPQVTCKLVVNLKGGKACRESGGSS